MGSIKSRKSFRKSLFVSVMFACCLSGINLAQGNITECPKVGIVSPNGVFNVKKGSIVRAEITGDIPKEAELTWGTSLGKIVSKNGTSQTELYFDKADQGRNVSVFLRIDGLPEACAKIYSEIIAVAAIPEAEPLDRFVDSGPNEVKSHIDNFFVAIDQDAQYVGLIEVYFNKNDSDARKLRSLGKVFQAIKFRNYDVSKVQFLVGETAGKTRFVLWLFHPDGELPGDREKSDLIKGVDLMKDPRKALVKSNCKC